ncbi:D-arabinose 5-phosphate [Phenylobacterium sp. Root77]|uniref:KpsF/GutQ family sugar-phosphate isomerase n=1 Tax=unclassified Phenylobacterium TaxID=2640670 RepID=UPI000700BD4E|nr:MULTISPECIES: KpsF/GutQ family sugar-phosphate isomerase [unclassified Phenylobacterium]KQW73555.1 D-arabinose 5-phosphate [Phenylobacterium sp. Root1277]KQW92790.1 D-arabinose 5-phosphate [Phenylobacterium sp. Root1290]KRC41737.1 D-arabinose 5-phosphate [Phenylobacterium sp. Root77]
MTKFDAVAVGRRVLTAEADALRLQADTLGEAFEKAVDLLHAAKGRVICTGIGKSGHVAKKIAATFASTGAPAFFVHANEASHGDLGMIAEGDVILALSKSGQNQELADVIAYSRRFHIPLIALTAFADSPLGQAADVALLLADTTEVTSEVKAPTTSTTLQIALGDALAVSLLERRGFSAKDFKIFHPGGKLGAMLRTVGDLMHGKAELPLVREDTPMSEALLVMTEKAFGIVGVTDAGGALKGVITDGDLRRHLDGLLTHTAGDVMTAGPKKTAPPQMLAAEALALMSDPLPMVTVLFVVENGRPVGILRVHDLVRAGV